jgi:tetratricopeptide (TPR) repeat protein
MGRGYKEKAGENFKEAFEFSSELSDKKEIAEDYRNLANLSFSNGKRIEAEKLYLKALGLTREVGDFQGAGQDCTYLGNLKFKDSLFEEAEEYFNQASSCFEQTKSWTSLVQFYLTVARMEIMVSRYDPADVFLAKAREIARDLGDPEQIMKAIKEIDEFKNTVDKK